MRPASKASITQPPTTPPAIAPLDVENELEEAGDPGVELLSLRAIREENDR